MLPNSGLPKPLLPAFNPPASLLVIAAMGSTQLGSTLAKSLFGQVGPLGMVLLRVGLSAVVLVAWCRPRWRGHRLANYRLLVTFGLSLAVMNALFYCAIARIPIGVAVALEFSGPLTVALLHSRRWLDGLWVALAAVGIVLLSPLNTPALDSLGVVMALLAGVAWGAYIVLSARMGQAFRGGEGLALSMAVGALLLLPVGIMAEGRLLLSPNILLLGLGVAMLASTLPYSLEMTALRRMPVNVFGVLMSLEPAIAAVISFFWLGETLSLTMIGAIGLVTIAAAGVSLFQPATKVV
ncbi:EamA family transporter [Phormidium tenue]|uniref:EamA family transporter n=1 Tax=Phormidium tenue NIES-30 TaxID=549789 RepID=A0A1U7J1P5_9CYAN|nr:EamA family transporter [Phormidium tenue]MBD2232132.1 EamA family transporter [Phormidium tenue FACHB-1052]OKH45916.1 EamA family transporter [Phormidium tenue NIES-30]